MNTPMYLDEDFAVRECAAVSLSDADGTIELALWDDGSLWIGEGNDLHVYSPDVVRRLARLLTALEVRQ